jgi:hypothetical protein
MSTFSVNSFGALARLFAKHQKERQQKVERAARKAASKGVSIVKRKIPVAFGELRESAHREGTSVVVDAPHAAPVEVGSRPHMPPLEPILRWVKLRGAQGLLSARQQQRLPGTTTASHALSVAIALKAQEKDGALDVNAPLRIARAIQHAIAKHGTKPHWYARSALPLIRAALDAIVREELRG